jgi:BirA family biotin operon repressor/biotin-[acetyl-CoA-carboxylase] ligase
MFTSLAFEPAWPIEAWSQIPLAAGMAARSAISGLTSISVGLRWPNDLVIGDGKVGGLLAESGDGVVVVGCGINVLWTTPIEGGAALYEADPGPEIERDLATTWADRLLDLMAIRSDGWGIDEYRDACVTVGRSVSYAAGSGTAVGVSGEGALLVETADGVIAVNSGEVRLHDRATLPTDSRRN